METKNPLYHANSIGEYHIPTRKNNARLTDAKISNNSETTKFIIINLIDIYTILLQTTSSTS